jgi:hypothetical protein
VAGNPLPSVPPHDETLPFLTRHCHPTSKTPGLMAELGFATLVEGMGLAEVHRSCPGRLP